VSAGSVLWSLTSFVVFYGILLAAFLYFVRKVIRRGPVDAPP